MPKTLLAFILVTLLTVLFLSVVRAVYRRRLRQSRYGYTFDFSKLPKAKILRKKKPDPATGSGESP